MILKMNGGTKLLSSLPEDAEQVDGLKFRIHAQKCTYPWALQNYGYVKYYILPLSGVVFMGGLVFAVGGFNGSLRVRTVDSYDPVKDQWTTVANMQDRRSTLGAAVLNGVLYAVGGFDGSTGV